MTLSPTNLDLSSVELVPGSHALAAPGVTRCGRVVGPTLPGVGPTGARIAKNPKRATCAECTAKETPCP